MSDLIGSIGVGLLLLAFAGRTTSRLDEGYVHASLNAAGAALAAIAAVMISFVPFVILECAWFAVAVISLFNAGRWPGRRPSAGGKA